MNHNSNRYIGTQIFIVGGVGGGGGGLIKINKRKITCGRILVLLT